MEGKKSGGKKHAIEWREGEGDLMGRRMGCSKRKLGLGLDFDFGIEWNVKGGGEKRGIRNWGKVDEIS